MAIGAGWQAAVAYVNIGCYYIFGIPLGLILGYKLQMGVQVSLTTPFFNVPNHDPFLFKSIHWIASARLDELQIPYI